MRTRVLLPYALLTAVPACHHVSGGDSLDDFLGPALTTTGAARFLDVDRDGKAGPGDLVVVPFNVPLRVNVSDPDVVFDLRVDDDTFGQGATLGVGPSAKEVQVTLGADPRLRARGRFDFLTTGNAPSGLAIQDTIPPNAVENAKTGRDLVATGVDLDLVPAFVPEPAALAPALRSAIADLNLDGRPDVVTVDLGGEVDVWEAQAGGGYVNLHLDPVGARAVALGDLRANGRADLVVLTQDGLTIYENLSPAAGPITLGLWLSVPVPGGGASALALLDADRDGNLDVALASADGVRVVLNDGASLLVPDDPLQDSLAGAPALAAADFNRDGTADLFVARAGPGTNQVLVNDPCAGYLAQDVGDATDTARLDVGDVDGDGWLDVVAGGEGALELWLGGPGGFSPGGTPAAPRATALRLVDVDGDGALDLVWCDGQALRQAQNDGAGVLEELGVREPGVVATDLTSADLDGDGDADLLVADAAGALLRDGSLAGVWGRARFRPPTTDVGQGPLFAIEVADLDRDGLLDLVQSRSGSFEVRAGLGGGQFGPPTSYALGIGRARDLALGDLDRDGDLDLVLAVLGQGSSVWLNDGAGGFVAFDAPAAHRDQSVALGDLDRDGFLDLVFGRDPAQEDALRRNLGVSCLGGLPEWLGLDLPELLPGALATSDVALGDVDGDGDLDLLTAHVGKNPDRLFLNDGAGNLTETATTFPGRDTHALTLGDVDGDGDLDLVAGKPEASELWHNEGGSFVLAANLAPGATLAVDLVRLDGDALLDMVVGNRALQGFQLWRGTPDGLFSEGAFRRERTTSIRALTAADLNGDGAVDFVTGRDDAGPNELWLNL